MSSRGCLRAHASNHASGITNRTSGVPASARMISSPSSGPEQRPFTYAQASSLAAAYRIILQARQQREARTNDKQQEAAADK